MLRPIALDLETFLITEEVPFPRPVCVTWSAGERPLISKAVETVCRRILENKALLIVGQNVAYDFGVLLTWFPQLRPLIWDAYEAGRITDTRIRERLIDIANGELIKKAYVPGTDSAYSLGGIAKRRLQLQLDKGEDSWRLRYGTLVDVPLDDWPEAAKEYALSDAGTTIAVYHDQDERRGNYTLPTEFDDARASFGLALTSAWGIAVDHDRAVQLQTTLVQRMGELRGTLVDAKILEPKRKRDKTLLLPGFVPVEVELKKSSKAIQKLIVERWHGTGEVPTTPTGRIQMSKEVLEACGGDDLAALVEYTSLEKSGSTYVNKLVNARGFIHARFDAIGAESSRTSCRDPNLQNQPVLPGVRECFIARPGHVLVSCDYATQELRTLGQVCLDILGHSKLAEAFQKDPTVDLHQRFADDPALVGFVRQDAKAGNFGFPGGMGAASFVSYARKLPKPVIITEERAAQLRDGWFNMWPEMREYFRFIGDAVGRHGYGTIVIPRIGFRRGGVGFTNGCNTPFQGLAAQASKRAQWKATRRCYDERLASPLLGSRIVNFVHDELIAEVPTEALHEAAEDLEITMCDAMREKVPDVPPVAEASAMFAWSKSAKRVVDGAGRLQPWTP